MAGFWTRLDADYRRRAAAPAAPQTVATTPAAGLRPPARTPRRPGQGAPYGPDGLMPPGGFSYGTSILGGPAYVDPFQSRRAPSPWQLIEQYSSLVYAMVNRNREAVSRIPLRLFADGSRVQGGKPRRACDPIKVSRHVGARLARAGMVSTSAVDNVYEVRNHPFLDVLDRPDPWGYFSRKKLIGLMVAYMDVVGHAFLVPEGNGWDWRDHDDARKKGPPEYLWTIYSQYAIPFREAGSPLIAAFQYFRDYLPFGSVVWFRHSISLRDAYGSSYSPTYGGSLYADQEFRYTAIWDQILGIGPRPNLIASAKDPMNPPGEAERKRFEQDMQRRHAAGNAGGLLVLNGAYDITPVNYQGADMAAKTISEYDRNNLACIFGQPPTYYTTDTNLANLQAADEQYARNGIEPRCDTIADTLTNLVRRWDPRLFCRFDPALPEDDESRARVVDMKLKNGSITINQANEEERWPAVPWGDEPWLSGSLRQPSQIAQQHEQALETAKQGVETAKGGVEHAAIKAENESKMTEFQTSEPDDEEAGLADEGGGFAAEERALVLRERALERMILDRLRVA